MACFSINELKYLLCQNYRLFSENKILFVPYNFASICLCVLAKIRLSECVDRQFALIFF